jgi:DHA1 family tetracycline resistance protein-like MFS transporter
MAGERRVERRQHRRALVADSTHANQSEVQLEEQPGSRRRPPRLTHRTTRLLSQITDLRQKLHRLQRNMSLILVYLTIFLDFVGITLLSPGMRFMVDPCHDNAFDDLRAPAECCTGFDEAASGPPVAACDIVWGAMKPGTALSAMMVSFGLGQFLSTPLMGWSSDRFGRRRILIISAAGTTIGFLLQGLVWSFWPHVGTRFVAGLFAGSRPVCQAYISSMVPPPRRVEMMGYVSLCVMVALQFGPVLGGSLAVVSLRLPLFVGAALAAIVTVLLIRYLDEPPAPVLDVAGSSSSSDADGGGATGATPCTRVLLGLLSAGSMFSVASIIVCLPIMLADIHGLDPNAIGLLQFGDGVALLAGNLIFVSLSARFGVPRAACFGALLTTAQTGIPFFGRDSLLGLSAFRYLAMVGVPMTQPAAPAIVSMVAPAAQLGAWMAAMSTVQALVRATSPLLLGPLYDEFAASLPGMPFLLTAGGCCFTMGITLLLHARLPARPPPGAVTSTAEVAVPPLPTAEAEQSSAAESGGESSSGAERTDASHVSSRRCNADVANLCDEYSRLLTLVRGHESGEAILSGGHEEGDVSEADVREMGEWMAAMLSAQGYTQWAKHKAIIRALAVNSFPKVRCTSRVAHVEDLLSVLSAHFELERSWAARSAQQWPDLGAIYK